MHISQRRILFLVAVHLSTMLISATTALPDSIVSDAQVPNQNEQPLSNVVTDPNEQPLPNVVTDDVQEQAEPEVIAPTLRVRTKKKRAPQNGGRWHGQDCKELTLSIPDHPVVKKYFNQYNSKEGKKWLSAVIKRAYPYRAYIEAEIRKYNMPQELVFLPVIESSYVVTAFSRSGAAGIWQFMRNSIAPFGIRTSEWLDERYDPWKTTTAALRKLMENYKATGSWELALAAYNCGLGAVRKAIKKAGSNDYWYLADNHFLPDQTRNYVPKFLAVSYLLSHCGEYGIDTGWDVPAPEMTVIPVKRTVDVAVLASECNIDGTMLKKANPALLYGITPPDAPYELNVPLEYASTVANVLENSKKLLVKYYIYKIKSGDTFYALARHYGITVEMLQQYNPKLKPSALKIGKKVIIPALKEVSPYAGKPRDTSLTFNGRYTVQKGDTLWSIALAYDVQVEVLAEENNMDTNSILSMGKQLKVPILQ